MSKFYIQCPQCGANLDGGGMMHDGKVHRVQIDVEHKYLTEDSEVRLYLSEVRSKKKRTAFGKKVFSRAAALILEIFYSSAVTYFVGRWAVAAAYAERGYQAFGSEYLLVIITFALSFCIIKYFFER